MLRSSMYGLSNIAFVSSQDFWLSFILGWSLAALIIGAVLMLVINLLQNPPWPQGDESPGASDETNH